MRTYLEALNNLAYMLATAANPKFRDGPRAVQLAEKANRLRERDPALMETLAAAYAEAGRFPEARETAQKARDLLFPLARLIWQRKSTRRCSSTGRVGRTMKVPALNDQSPHVKKLGTIEGPDTKLRS